MIIKMIPADRGTTTPSKPGFLTSAATNIAIKLSRQLVNDGLADAVPNLTPTSVADGLTGRPLRNFADLFYFRVWMLPPVLDVQNPKIGLPIEFQIWNSYLGPNELEALVPTDATGVTLDLIVGDIIPALGLQTVTAIIDNTAPTQIDALFAFDFSQGNSLLRFLALLADILPIQPDSIIVETFDWMTDVLQMYDGGEQRIKIRPRPRRSFKIALTILNDADRKVLYDKLFKTVALTIIAPSYQYQSRLKSKTVIGDNKLYTNTRRADLRAGENVLIVTRENEFFLYEVDEVFADHVTITTAFSQPIPKGSVVSGAFEGRIPNKSGLKMASIKGSSDLNILLTNSRDQIAWPDYAPTVPTFHGKPLLLRRALADSSEANENFDSGLEIIDNLTGKPDYRMHWKQPFVEGERSYLVQSMLDQNELEFWRAFIDSLSGKHKTFYTPTYREDLIRKPGTDFLQSEITVIGTEYASLYDGKPTHQQIEIETDLGTFQVSVSSGENLGDSTKLHFADLIPVTVVGAVVTRISYLMLVRLGTDKVSLTHYSQHTIVDLSLRMAAG